MLRLEDALSCAGAHLVHRAGTGGTRAVASFSRSPILESVEKKRMPYTADANPLDLFS